MAHAASSLHRPTEPGRPAHPVIAIAATGAIYWVAARLALWLAIPPGYATAVWPAAGLGLICVLVWGPRAAAGIAIGSCLVNIGTGFDDHSMVTIARSFGIAGAIGSGAALEALIGAALIRRRVGFPSALDDERDIVWLVVLGGPVACLASSTIGVATLVASGAVAWSGAAFSWWTWWVGDTIGVLVFAPLAIVALPTSHAVLRRRRSIVGLPLVLGFAAVTGLFVRVSGWERARLRTDFERRAAPIEAILKSQLSTYEEVVTSLVSFFDASVTIERSEFHAFCERAVAKYPAILALSWDPHVLAIERDAFEARARNDGLAGFRFTERGPSGALRTADQRAGYVPVFYIEPAGRNAAVLGYDIASEANRRDLFEQVRRHRTPAVSQQLPLLQGGPAPVSGVLLVAPVFSRPDVGALRGYAVGAFSLRDVVEIALRDVEHDGMRVSLVDRSAAGSPVLYTTDTGTAIAASEQLTVPLSFGGRQWQVEVAPTAAAMVAQRSWLAWTVLAAGLLFVGLLGIILLVTTGRTFRIYEAAVEREGFLGQLTALNAELEQRVQSRTSELSAALREREVLLQEVHHRVKNNLQVISSLINMQVRKLDDRTSRDALEECQTRVQAIALIHEQLYQSRNYARVPFSEYARTLVRSVFHTMHISPSAVELDMAIDDFAVPVDKAIPCGLLLNELITNALKHAFKDGRHGRIRVALAQLAGRVRLVVEDNGLGLPPGLDIRGTHSFGLQLVTTLAEQLDATLEVSAGGGARFEITFAVDC